MPIELPHSLFTTLRSGLRRLGFRTSSHGDPPVYFSADENGLIIRAQSPNVAVSHRVTGDFEKGDFSVPLSLIDEAKGRGDEPVRIERSGNRVSMQWHNGRVSIDHDLCPAQDLKSFPELPRQFEPQPIEFRQALADAMALIDRESSRYALGCVQLSGQKRRIVATDGRQMLVQGDFTFPWNDNVLVPANRAFDTTELTKEESIALGKSGEWIAFATGHWAIWFRQHDGRYPRVDDLLRDPASANTTLSIGQADADFLRQSLATLPSDHETHLPVTLDLNGRIALRARPATDATPTELVLQASRYRGEPLGITFNRTFLAQAVKLGFGDVCFKDRDSTVYCDDGKRQYLWIPLHSEMFIPHSDQATRIESPLPVPGSSHIPSTTRMRTTPIKRIAGHTAVTPIPAATNEPWNHTASNKPRRRKSSRSGSTLEEAIAVRDALIVAFSKSRELVRALKRQKRQSRLVETTLQSLKQLQSVA